MLILDGTNLGGRNYTGQKAPRWNQGSTPEPNRFSNFEKGYKEIRQSFHLGHDVLCHSYISYHCAKYQSGGATALQAGNSESIVRKHYLKTVSYTHLPLPPTPYV